VRQPVNQTNRAMMAQLQAFGQFGDRDKVATREAFDGEQGLMLLRGQPGLTGGVLAEIQKPPQRVPQGGQRFVVRFGDLSLGHVRERR